MKISIVVWVGLLSLPVCAPAQAQPASRDSAIIVTSSIAPQDREHLPFTFETIDQITLQTSQSVADALSQIAQVHVQMVGGRTGFASAFVRGADPNFTATLLDGVPLNSPTNSRGGAVNLAEIPTAGLAGAELVVSPSSSLYGSGPLAATLNLSLPAPARAHQLALGGSIAGKGEATASAVWQGPLAGEIGGSVVLVFDDSGSWIPQSRLRSRSFDLRIAPFAAERGRLLIHYANRDSRGFPDSSGGPELAIIRQVDARDAEEWIVALNHTLSLGRVTDLTLAASWFDRSDSVLTPGIAPSPFSPGGIPAGKDDIEYRQAIGSAIITHQIAQWRLSLGAQAQSEKATSAGYLDLGVVVPSSYDADRTTLSALAEAVGRMGPVSITGNLRVDDIEAVGTELTGRLGARLALGSQWALRASYGTAFKAPSFYALFNPFIGNPALRPESGRGMEAGLDWRPANSSLVSLVAFHSRFRDLIDFVPANPPRLENRSRVTTKGVALSANHQLHRTLRLSAEVAYVHTADAGTGASLLNRPEWRASAAADWSAMKDFTLAARYSHTGPRVDFAVPLGVARLDPIDLVSASASYDANRQLRLAVEVANLLASDAQDAIGFPMRPRRVRFSLTQRFD